MKTPLLIALFLIAYVTNAQVLINEVDCDQVGVDAGEFVELFGPPNNPLDGLVLVFYNGSTDLVYDQFDLNGYALDDNGFFVLGNEDVESAQIIFPGNSLQNGADAVVLYEGNIENYSNGHPVSLGGIVDAIVYDTGDADDPGLLPLLLAGQPQVDEGGLGQSVSHANARIPDGGQAQVTLTYVQQLPTPGITNLPVCIGGMVETTEADVEVAVCVDDIVAELSFQTTPENEDSYAYFLTDNNDIIITQIDGESFDFAGEEPGECRVHGVGYSGVLFTSTTAAGQPISGVSGTSCAAVSENYITVTKLICEAVCEAGVISSSMGNEVVMCLNDEGASITFSHNSPLTEPVFLFVVVGEDGLIESVVVGDYFSAETLGLGIWSVYNVAYIGAPVGLTDGAVFSNSSASECLDVSNNFISIEIIECEEGLACGDLFFSEYLEGTGNNKALEIYNPTEEEIDLSIYEIWIYANGSADPTGTISLSGALPSGETFVVCNAGADEDILQVADLLTGSINFNGDDALQLVNDGAGIDVIGFIGEAPAEGYWYTTNGSTQDHTLVRGATEGSATTSWPLSAGEWVAYDSDSFQFIGNHLFAGCGDLAIPIVTFDVATQQVEEGELVNVVVQVINPIYGVTVNIDYTGGTATDGDDFVHPFPSQIDFPQGTTDPVSFSIPTNDDEESEGAEDIVFMLSSETDDSEFLLDTHTIIIAANDPIIPTLSIAEVSGMDENFEADSLGVSCELHGVVHGVNLNPLGLKFTMIDPSDGISVFHQSENLGYTVVEGDSIHVFGSIAQFNGLHTLEADSIHLISADNELQNPMPVTALDETTESQMVVLECVSLVDPTQWSNDGSGFNADVTNGEETMSLYIPSATDVFGTDAPEGVFNVIGIGNQYDSFSPYDEGYELVPRYLEDFSETVSADFEVFQDDIPLFPEDEPCIIFGGLASAEFELMALGNGDNYSWSINGFSADGPLVEMPDGPSDFGVPFNDPTIITLEVQNLNTGCSAISSQEYCAEVGGSIPEAENFGIQLWPNPADQQFMMSAVSELRVISLYTVDGKLVYKGFPASKSHEIDVSSLAVGTYLVLVEADNTLYQSKIIVK
jgi:hypothetical protein